FYSYFSIFWDLKLRKWKKILNFIIYSLINYELMFNEYIFITRIDMKKIIIILRIFYLVEKCRIMRKKKDRKYAYGIYNDKILE
ncbi:hypothetical protein, partial [Clostridium perfringens]